MSDEKSQANQLWRDWLMNDAFRVERIYAYTFHMLPHDPRCKLCNSPFGGAGDFIMRSL